MSFRLHISWSITYHIEVLSTRGYFRLGLGLCFYCRLQVSCFSWTGRWLRVLCGSMLSGCLLCRSLMQCHPELIPLLSTKTKNARAMKGQLNRTQTYTQLWLSMVPFHSLISRTILTKISSCTIPILQATILAKNQRVLVLTMAMHRWYRSRGCDRIGSEDNEHDDQKMDSTTLGSEECV